jgi:hypothetical protein
MLAGILVFYFQTGGTTKNRSVEKIKILLKIIIDRDGTYYFIKILKL